jgi:hypothetical protein
MSAILHNRHSLAANLLQGFQIPTISKSLCGDSCASDDADASEQFISSQRSLADSLAVQYRISHPLFAARQNREQFRPPKADREGCFQAAILT